MADFNNINGYYVCDDIARHTVNANSARLDELEKNGVVYAEQYLKFNESDESADLQRLIDYARSEKKHIIFPREKEIYINNPIKLGVRCMLDFNGCTINVNYLHDNNYNDFIFVLNSNDGVTQDALHPTSENVESHIKNLNLVNKGQNKTLKGFFVAGACKFENIRTVGLAQQIKWPENYIDYAVVDGWACNVIQSHPNGGVLFQFEKLGQGDNLTLKNIHLPTGQSHGHHKLIKIKACNGGIIEGITNGSIEVYFSTGVTIKNCHIEEGTILVKQSAVTLLDNYIRKQYAHMITIEGVYQGNDTWNPPLTLINNQFVLDYYKNKYDVLSSDINIENYCGDLLLINNTRYVYPSNGATNRRYHSGINIYTGNENLLVNNNIAQVKNKKLIKENILVPFNQHSANNEGWYNILTVACSTLFQGNINNTFHYYALIGVYDAIRKLGTGYTDAGKKTPGNQNEPFSNIITINQDLKNSGASLLLYRGTLQRTYSNYIMIPSADAVIDNGYSVNGFLWKERTAQDVDAYNLCYGIEKINDINILAYLLQQPAVGEWQKGDFYYNLTTDVKYKYNGASWVEV